MAGIRRRVCWLLLVSVLATLTAPGARAQISREWLAFAGAPYDHALDFVDLLVAGRYREAEALLSPDARRVWSASSLEAAWKEQERRSGPYFKREVSAADILGDRWRIHVLVLFAHGRADAAVELTSLSDDPTVLGFQFHETAEGRLPG